MKRRRLPLNVFVGNKGDLATRSIYHSDPEPAPEGGKLQSGNQTRRGAMIETVANVSSGFIVSLLVWHFGIRPALHSGLLSVDQSILITLIFTVLSILRGYIWRRIFTRR